MDYSQVYNFCLKSYAKIPSLIGGGKAFRPMSLFVEVTYRCNFRCNMCQFLNLIDDGRLKDKIGDELSADEIKSVIDEILPFGLIGFTGGEPLLRKDIMELVRHASKRHKVYLVTNGILLKEDISAELVSLGAGSFLGVGVAAIGISLEGMGEAHDKIVEAPGSYEKILANVDNLVKAKQKSGKKYPLVALKCVITQSNVSQLDDMYKLAEKMEVDIFNPITLYNMPSTDRFDMDGEIGMDAPIEPIKDFDMPLLEDQLGKILSRASRSKVQLRLTPPGFSKEDVISVYANRLNLSNKACYSPWSSAVLSAYGDVTPCSNYSVGNIREERFLKLWNNEKMRKFRLALSERKIFPACHACCAMVSEGAPVKGSQG